MAIIRAQDIRVSRDNSWHTLVDNNIAVNSTFRRFALARGFVAANGNLYYVQNDENWRFNNSVNINFSILSGTADIKEWRVTTCFFTDVDAWHEPIGAAGYARSSEDYQGISNISGLASITPFTTYIAYGIKAVARDGINGQGTILPLHLEAELIDYNGTIIATVSGDISDPDTILKSTAVLNIAKEQTFLPYISNVTINTI